MQRILIAFAVIAAVTAGVFFSRPATTASGQNIPPVNAEAPNQTAPTLVMPVTIVLEAEEYASIEDKFNTTTVMQVKEEMHGVPLKYIEIPDGFIKSCGLEKAEPGKLPGKLSYTIDIPRDDTYYVFIRAQWFDDCGNSVWFKFDEGAWNSIEDQNGEITKTSYKFAWHALNLEGSPKGFALKKGTHTVWLNTKEDGPRLDQLLISTEASMPVGEAKPKTPR